MVSRRFRQGSGGKLLQRSQGQVTDGPKAWAGAGARRGGREEGRDSKIMAILDNWRGYKGQLAFVWQISGPPSLELSQERMFFCFLSDSF